MDRRMGKREIGEREREREERGEEGVRVGAEEVRSNNAPKLPYSYTYDLKHNYNGIHAQ